MGVIARVNYFILAVVFLLITLAANLARLSTVQANGATPISDCEDLQAIDGNLGGSYKLTQDINCGFEEIFYSENFEGSTGGWTSSGQNNSWHLDTETCQSQDSPKSPYSFGSKAYGTNGNAAVNCDYPGENDGEEDCDLTDENNPNSHNCTEVSRLISPVISLPDNDDLYLQFYSWGYDEGGPCTANQQYDSKDVAVTTNGGQTLTVLNDCEQLHPYVGDVEEPNFRVQWLPLDGFSNQNIQLVFNYDTRDSCCDFEVGWFVDNLKIGDAAPAVGPIADSDGSFSGTLDGDGHAIEFITIEDDDANTGLFGSMNGATVKNLEILGGSVSGSQNVGSVAGTATASTLSNVHSWMPVTTAVNEEEEEEAERVGGLVGHAVVQSEQTMLIEKSSFRSATVEADSSVGGLVGEAQVTEGSLTIRQSWVTGSVEADDEAAGGLVGRLGVFADNNAGSEAAALIEDTYTQGYVTSDDITGGLVGRAEAFNDDQEGSEATITIRRSYSSGELSSYGILGGLVGINITMDNEGENLSLVNNFTASEIDPDGESSYGGLFGTLNNGDVPVELVNNFYDSDRADVENIGCSNNYAEIDGCTAIDDSDYFEANSSSPPLNTWNFAGIWYTTSLYPTLTPNPKASTDGDKIPDVVENAGPNGGDANDDGTLDSLQDNVASFVNGITGKYVVLQADAEEEDCVIESVTMAAEGANSVQDSGYDYASGLMSFRVGCDEDGVAVNITQFYYGTTMADLVLRKYRPDTNAYFTITEADLTQTTIGGQVVTIVSYVVVDGGPLDLDGEENGEVTDPTGLASQTVGAPNTGLGGRR